MKKNKDSLSSVRPQFVRYTVNNEGGFDDAKPKKNNGFISNYHIAELCAKEFYNSNIYGDIVLDWSVTITLWDEDGVRLGDYNVSVHYTPDFYASNLIEDGLKKYAI